MVKKFIEDKLKNWDVVWQDNGSSYALCCGNAMSVLYVRDVNDMLSRTPKAQQDKEFDSMIAKLNWNEVAVRPSWANREWEQLSFEV